MWKTRSSPAVAWIPVGSLVNSCHVSACTSLPTGSPLPQHKQTARFGAKLYSKPFAHSQSEAVWSHVLENISRPLCVGVSFPPPAPSLNHSLHDLSQGSAPTGGAHVVVWGCHSNPMGAPFSRCEHGGQDLAQGLLTRGTCLGPGL